MVRGLVSFQGPYPETRHPFPLTTAGFRALSFALHETVIVGPVAAVSKLRGCLRFAQLIGGAPSPPISELPYDNSVYKTLRKHISVNYPRATCAGNRERIMRRRFGARCHQRIDPHADLGRTYVRLARICVKKLRIWWASLFCRVHLLAQNRAIIARFGQLEQNSLLRRVCTAFWSRMLS